MKRLSKSSKPIILVTKEVSWTQALMIAIASGDNDAIKAAQRKYRHDAIKQALILETGGKCAYCESAIRHVAPGDIEHIFPKSRFPEKCFDWSNMTLGCAVCNGSKLDYHSNSEPLLNPYAIDPDDHLFASCAHLFAFPGSTIGKTTIDVIALNRPELIERRQEKIESLWHLAYRWANLSEGLLKDIALEAIRDEITLDKEYSMISRGFLKQAGVPIEGPN